MDILVEIVDALERDAVPAEIRIASILDRIRCLGIPSTGSRSLSLLAVEAYERGYQEALTKLRTADEDYSEGFKAGRAMKKNDGKNAFEAGVEKGKRDTEKKHEQEINHLQSALSQAGKNYFDIAEQRDTAYARGYQEAKNNIAKLQQEELDEHFNNGYAKGYKDSTDRFSTHEETYQNGFNKGRKEGQQAGFQSGVHTGEVRHKEELEKAKEEYAAEVLGLTYKNEQALEVKWREGYREGKAVSDKVIEETYANGLRAGKMQKVQAIVDEARSRGYQNGLKDGYYNGLQAAAKAVDTKILAVTCKEPTLHGMATPAPKPIPPLERNQLERNQVMTDTSNWDTRGRARQ